MDKLTHATRLKRFFEQLEDLPNKSCFNKNQSLLVMSVEHEELDTLWKAAQSCFSEIERIFKDDGRFPERTSKAMEMRIDQVKLAISNKAFLKDFIHYRGHNLNKGLYNDLDLIDALLDEKEIFENFDEESISEVLKNIIELKKDILKAEISNDLKKPFLSLLNRMQEIFEQYELYGEQDIEIITQRWAGTLFKYSEELIKDKKIKDKSLGLLGDLWKSYLFTGDNIARIQAFNSILPD